MKFKTSKPVLALLCVSLLLLPVSSSAMNYKPASVRKPKCKSTSKAKCTSTKKPKSAKTRKETRPQKPASTTIMLPPAPTLTLAGSYRLINPSAANATVEAAIEYAVKGMLFEGRARGELKKTNLPPPQQITIWYSAADISIKTDQSGLIQTPADGRPIKWTSKYNDNYDVSTIWVSGNLERTFKSSRGRRVNTYSLSPDGRMLTMKVTAKTEGRLTPSFKHPFNYHLEFRRN
jgi:hypothetical protein